MATVPTLPRKKRIYTNDEKRKQRKKIYNSKEWKNLRINHLQKEPLCAVCLKLGKVVSGEDVHHIKSFMTSSSVEDMNEQAFNPDNLVTLCHYHHSLLHSLDEFKKLEFKTADELADYLIKKEEEEKRIENIIKTNEDDNKNAF